jgi:gluconolactonase
MKIREIASGLQFPEGPVAMSDGSVVLVEIARGTLSRVTPDGRIHVLAALGGGPNGAAIGPDSVTPAILGAVCDPSDRLTTIQADA